MKLVEPISQLNDRWDDHVTDVCIPSKLKKVFGSCCDMDDAHGEAACRDGLVDTPWKI